MHLHLSSRISRVSVNSIKLGSTVAEPVGRNTTSGWTWLTFVQGERKRGRRRKERKRKRWRFSITTPKVFLRFFWTWTKRSLITLKTRVKRISRMHHRTILSLCIRRMRLNLVCKVTYWYHLVQVPQNLKKWLTFQVLAPSGSGSFFFFVSSKWLHWLTNSSRTRGPRRGMFLSLKLTCRSDQTREYHSYQNSLR